MPNLSPAEAGVPPNREQRRDEQFARTPPMDWAQAAEYLGTTVRHVERLKTDGLLAFVKIRGKVRFLADDLDELVARGRVEAR